MYSLPAESVTFSLVNDTPLTPGDAVVLAFTPDGGSVYYQLPPGLTLRVGGRWTRGRETDQARGLGFEQATLTDNRATAAWDQGGDQGTHQNLPWGDAPPKPAPPQRLPWAKPPPQQTDTRLAGDDADDKDRAASAAWGAPPRQDLPPYSLPWGKPLVCDLLEAGRWRATTLPTPALLATGDYRLPTAPLAIALTAVGNYRLPSPPLTIALSAMGTAVAQAPLRIPADRPYLLPWGQPPAHNDDYALAWGWGHSKYRKDARWRINYPDTDDPIYKLPEPGDDPIEQDTIIMANLITVTRVSDGLPLAVHDLRIDLDIDSWAWKFTGTVINQATLAAIVPGGWSGTPAGLVDIRVEINGHAWVFMVESYTGATRHGDQRWTIQGVSRTQYMAAPYAQTSSYANAAQINAVQACDDVLEYTGFLLDWVYFGDGNTPDWTYPVGSLSYQDRTPLEVLLMIARSAGAVLIPHKAADGWVLQPRLRASPWDLDSGYMNSIVNQGIVTQLGEQYQPSPLYNAAYVSGTHYGQGVSVSRYFSGGDKAASDLFDQGIVAHDQAKERARQIIANSGSHSLVTLTCGLPGASTAPGLIEPGDQLAFQGAGQPGAVAESSDRWRGYVLGVSISAPGSGAVNVNQTARIIRYHEH